MVWTVRLLDDEVAIFHSKLSNNQRAYVVWGYLGHAERAILPDLIHMYIEHENAMLPQMSRLHWVYLLYDLCRIRMDSCE